MVGIKALSRKGAGRPTRQQAEARHEELLESALDHFLERGFEPATVEAIAASVNMTKRTVYARYSDKTALFRAAVRRAIERTALPQERIEAAISNHLEHTLENFARLRVDAAMTADGLRLQRIINTESYRFPDIFMIHYDYVVLPVIECLAQLLEAETRAGRLAIDDPMMAANMFVSMVVTGPVRVIVSGNYLSPEQITARIRFGIRLFLEGARQR